MPPPADGDQRSSRQRRADALEDLARTFLDLADASGSRVVPHINVHIDLPALQGSAGGLHETDDETVLTEEVVSQLGCDATVSRIVFGPGAEVLEVGRKRRLVSTAQRRAVVARDRHCVWSGCGRRPSWCDVHHVVAWVEGGTTDVTNLVLLCRYHHTLVHADPVHQLELAELQNPAMAGRRS